MSQKVLQLLLSSICDETAKITVCQKTRQDKCMSLCLSEREKEKCLT